MFKLVFYVPTTHAEEVKAAIFAAGAGRIGHYDHCCWQVVGRGEFRPLEGSHPAIGEHNQLTCIDEMRIETVCEDARVNVIVAALRQAHPYEEPAFDVWQLADLA